MRVAGFAPMALTLLAAGLLGGCAQQTRSGMDIDSRADRALREMSAAIGKPQAISFQSSAVMDRPVETGQLAQFSSHSRVVLRRPDRARVELRRGSDALIVWYRGTQLTVLDETANLYATDQVPGSIEKMLDCLVAKYRIVLPLADLLFPDPYAALTADVKAGKYLGEQEVDGVKCRHLIFMQDALSWQVWIGGPQGPLPRKVVIDYKRAPGAPQFVAVLSDWDLAAPAGDEVFTAVLPKETKQVTMAKLLGGLR